MLEQDDDDDAWSLEVLSILKKQGRWKGKGGKREREKQGKESEMKRRSYLFYGCVKVKWNFNLVIGHVRVGIQWALARWIEMLLLQKVF